MVKRRYARRNIPIAYSVNHIKMFSSVKVKEPKPILRGTRRGSRFCRHRIANGKERKRSHKTDK